MLMQLVYILDRKLKADRMLNFVLMRSAFCRGVQPIRSCGIVLTANQPQSGRREHKRERVCIRPNFSGSR